LKTSYSFPRELQNARKPGFLIKSVGVGGGSLETAARGRGKEVSKDVRKPHAEGEKKGLDQYSVSKKKVAPRGNRHFARRRDRGGGKELRQRKKELYYEATEVRVSRVRKVVDSGQFRNRKRFRISLKKGPKAPSGLKGGRFSKKATM